MAGHDYDCGWYDVKNAVDDFFGKNDLDLGVHQGVDSAKEKSQKYWNIGDCWGVILMSDM